MSHRILFFGNEQLATGVKTDRPSFRALQQAGYEVIEVSKEIDKAQLAGYGAEAAVLIAYGVIIPAEILGIFPVGVINVHPSLLPLYRGSTPIETAILDGVAETGVSLMKLVPEMDAGPVYAQQSITLSGQETKQELADKLAEMGSQMVVEHLPAILDGSLQPQPQDDSRATFTDQLTKEDGSLDFTKPAIQLEREVRAFAGWPRSRTKIKDTEIVVTAARVIEGTGEPGKLWRDGKDFGFYTQSGILVVDQLIPAGKKAMSAEAFLAGYQIS